MNDATFWPSFNGAIDFLKKANLFKEENRHTGGQYSSAIMSSDHLEIYNRMVNNRDFDIQLFDDSLFQLSLKNGESRMVYVQNPQKFLSFEDFLMIQGFNPVEYSVDELRGYFAGDYEQCCSEMALNKAPVYIRYDEDSKGRREGAHSYAHIHIGLNNEIRLPVSIYLTPLSYVTFVIHQVYYDKWQNIISKDPNLFGYINHKSTCEPLDKSVWSSIDECFLHLK